MTDFSLLMTGLCAFVPRYKIKERREGNRMRVLLVDSSKPAILSHDNHHQHIHELHVPVLVCNYDDVDGWGRTEDLRFIDEKGIIKALFYLDDQDVEIVSEEKEGLIIHGDPISNDCYYKDNSSFYCVAPLEMISPEAACPPKECFSDAKVHGGVISRMVLKEGTIKTGQLANQPDEKGKYRVVNWSYKMIDQRSYTHKQVAADIVQLDVKLSKVTLKTRLFREPRNPAVSMAFGNNKELLIRLKPKSKVQVFIKNMPWPDILGTRPVEEYYRKVDLHFAHFYKICDDPKPEINLPHLDELCKEGDPRHGGNPNCQPCLFCPRREA